MENHSRRTAAVSKNPSSSMILLGRLFECIRTGVNILDSPCIRIDVSSRTRWQGIAGGIASGECYKIPLIVYDVYYFSSFQVFHPSAPQHASEIGPFLNSHPLYD